MLEINLVLATVANGWKAARLWLLAVALVCSSLTGAAAQGAVTDIATYKGPDRTERLIEGARKEGSLMLYSSLQNEEIAALRGVQRTLVESRGGRYEVDVAETSGTEMEAIAREKLLREIELPAFADLIPQALMPHRQWVATRLSVFVGAYNRNLVKPAEAPKSYEDLLDPKWKGKLGVEADDAPWFMTLAGAMGEQKGIKLFRDIVAANGVSVRKGHTLLANLVASGEVPLALTTYVNRIEHMKASGAPVEPLFLAPVVALPTGGGIMRRAPHPYAAVLFLDFLLTEGQKILGAMESVPTNRTVREPRPDMIFVDVPKLLDERDKWTKLYKQTFQSQAR